MELVFISHFTGTTSLSEIHFEDPFSKYFIFWEGVALPTKVGLVKAMVFPVVMYGCESWTIRKAECQRIDAFELRIWRRLLRVLGLQGDPTSPS